MTKALNLEEMLGQIPLGRLGTADEVAGESYLAVQSDRETEREGQRDRERK